MNSEHPTFYYVNAHAGSGKTYSAHQFIKRNPGYYTIATQTNDLSEQQKQDLAEIGIKGRVISLKNNKAKTCTEQYARHCKDLRGSVALINQKVALQDLDVTADQHLIVDEFPSPVEKFVLSEGISATRSFIANLIRAEECEFAGFLEVVDTDDTTELAETGKKQNHSLKEHVIHLCERIHSPHYRVFVSVSNYTNFSSGLMDDGGVTIDDEESKQRLVLYAWLQPSVLKNYKSVTFMGANFAYQKLFYYWRDKVNWLPHPEIAGTRYEDFSFSHKAPLIEFRHMNEDGLTAWNYLSKKIGYDVFKESVADVIEREYPGEKYLVTLSAKDEDDGYWSSSNGTVISANPVGINAFQDRHMGVHLAPLNPSDMDKAIWQAVANVSEAELLVAQAIEMQYQAFTRTSVRDGKHHTKCKKPLVFITLDLAIADFLRSIFGVEKPSRLLVVPALAEYVKPPRKSRSDKKTPEEKREARRISQQKRRAANRSTIVGMAA